MPLKLKISKKEFGEIIRNFKLEAYAGGGKYSDTPYNTKRYVCERGIWRFTDEYDGDAVFSGMERLARIITSEKCFGVWQMGYYGKFLGPPILKNDTFDFLKEALRGVDIDYPFRGPVVFRSENPKFKGFDYINSLFEKQDVKFGSGCERILYKGDLEYKCYWVGGVLMKNLGDVIILP
jgi:hypothetical protein